MLGPKCLWSSLILFFLPHFKTHRQQIPSALSWVLRLSLKPDPITLPILYFKSQPTVAWTAAIILWLIFLFPTVSVHLASRMINFNVNLIFFFFLKSSNPQIFSITFRIDYSLLLLVLDVSHNLNIECSSDPTSQPCPMIHVSMMLKSQWVFSIRLCTYCLLFLRL